MNKAKSWWEIASKHFENSKKIFSLGDECLDKALASAITSIECALKGVLVKKGIFDEKSDKHHELKRILKKIKDNNCLPKLIVDQVQEILIKDRGIFIDKNFFSESTTAGKHTLFRYPSKNGILIATQIETNDVKEKINVAEIILELLKPFLTNK